MRLIKGYFNIHRQIYSCFQLRKFFRLVIDLLVIIVNKGHIHISNYRYTHISDQGIHYSHNSK